MGSVGNPRNWPPYDSYRDCSLGICSIYCPQWCYIIFPPPPPFEPRNDDSGTNFSPLIIAVIGILASAFLLVSYYTIISKYCKRRNQNHLNPTSEFDANQNQMTHDQWQLATGLDESVIKSIAVLKFVKGDGLIEGSDCAVCLSEFQENESLRLLPKCSHAFHVPCIDTWLRSHSNCPLCRSNLTTPTPPSNSQTSSNLNISSLEFQRRNETVLVVEERERGYRDEVVVVSFVNGLASTPKHPFQDLDRENGDQEFRRSVSLGSFSCQPNLLISDILKINDDDYDDETTTSYGKELVHQAGSQIVIEVV